MKPHIYRYNEKWFVQSPGWPIFGFIQRKSAYSYAKAIWRRRKG